MEKGIFYFCPECQNIMNKIELRTYTAHQFIYENGGIFFESIIPEYDYEITECMYCGETYEKAPEDFEVEIDENGKVVKVSEFLKDCKDIIQEKIKEEGITEI